MGYTLRYKHGVGANEQTEYNPSPEIIDSVINELLPGRDYYIVLSSDERVKNCDCVQTVIKWDDKPVVEYMIEVHFIKDGDFIYYRKYYSDAGAVKKMFRMFALGVIPAVDGWDDVTEEIKEIVRQKKCEKKNG